MSSSNLRHRRLWRLLERGPSVSGLNRGDIVHLAYNDGSENPWFFKLGAGNRLQVEANKHHKDAYCVTLTRLEEIDPLTEVSIREYVDGDTLTTRYFEPVSRKLPAAKRVKPAKASLQELQAELDEARARVAMLLTQIDKVSSKDIKFVAKHLYVAHKDSDKQLLVCVAKRYCFRSLKATSNEAGITNHTVADQAIGDMIGRGYAIKVFTSKSSMLRFMLDEA